MASDPKKALTVARPSQSLRWVEFLLGRKSNLLALFFMLAVLFPPGVSGVFYSFWLVPLLVVSMVLRNHRTLFYLRAGDLDLALGTAKRMLEESKGTLLENQHRLVLCHVLLERSEWDRAKAVLKLIDPDTLQSPVDRINYFQLLGSQWARLGDEKGLEAMTEAVAAECEDWGTSKDLQALLENNRAVVDLLGGRLEGAARRLQEIPVRGLGALVKSVTLNNLAWVELRRGGDPAKALQWSRVALRLAPKKRAIWGTHGAALLETGADPAKAYRYLEASIQALEEVPPQERAHVLAYGARALEALGRTGEARYLRERMHGLPGAEKYGAMGPDELRPVVLALPRARKLPKHAEVPPAPVQPDFGRGPSPTRRVAFGRSRPFPRPNHQPLRAATGSGIKKSYLSSASRRGLGLRRASARARGFGFGLARRGRSGRSRWPL